jgi:hypothetical protein
MNFLARLFSRAVRELEESNRELEAALAGKWGDVRLARMSFENGQFDVQCLHEGFAGILAGWAYNSLEACGAKNYVEITVVHPEKGLLAINIQKVSGERPAAKAARLERELMVWRDGMAA